VWGETPFAHCENCDIDDGNQPPTSPLRKCRCCCYYIVVVIVVVKRKMAISDRLKNLDAHSSVSKEFRVYTVYGAILSVATVVGEQNEQHHLDRIAKSRTAG
jgi:hypothetical protein